LSSPFKTRLAVRSTVLILLAIALVSIPFLLFLTSRARGQEALRQHTTLTQLMDTVERTAQVACFVEDVRLAEELEAGLLKNGIVGRVLMRSGVRVLAEQSRPGWRPGRIPAVSRVIRSPFDPKLNVGELTLFPDETEIGRQTTRQSRTIAMLLAFQAMAVAVASVGATLLLVTRPISRVSHQLNRLLKVEKDEPLKHIRGHESDEIGRLVEDVNALISRLQIFIHAERYLRDEVELDKAKLQEAKDVLEQTLAEVKTLQGLLPICAWCKKIRDDEGLWTQIENYVSSRADVHFTHGLCPECARREFGPDGAFPEDETPS
jgi:hypothetical protein